MDKLDRMLRSLPSETPAAELAGMIRREVQRRHRRRQIARGAGAALMGLLGLWLLWPAFAWLSPGELYGSGVPWLVSSLSYVNYASSDVLSQLWNASGSMQGAIGGAVDASAWLGALLLCCAIFLGLDPASWQSIAEKSSRENSTLLARSVHT